jgi:CHASE2 domain-containing sensor protein
MSIFEITIQRKSKDSWPVTVKFDTDDGLDNHAKSFFKFSDADFAELKELEEDVKEYGHFLGIRLFKNAVKESFLKAFNSHSDHLRVLLSIEVDNQDKLKVLHWERLCAPVDSGEWSHLALDQRFLFSQYIKTGSDRRYPPIERRDLRALILVASPDNLGDFKLAPFDVRATVDNARKALGNIPCDVLANGVEGAIGAPTLSQLCNTLSTAKKRYIILHIVCHGRLSPREDNDTQLYWATTKNSLERVSGNELLKNLRNQKNLPYFTFFSTCESADPRAESGLGGLAQRFVRELAMPAVVAMTRRISMKTALEFGENFYQRLGESGEVDLALAESTAGLGYRDDILVPVLFSRLGELSLFSFSKKLTLRSVMTISLCVAGVITLARTLGALMPLELNAYDQLMKLKPDERKDEHIFLVTVNDQDILGKYNQDQEGMGTLKDRPMLNLLQKLSSYKPQIIGLNIARDFKATSSSKLDPFLKKLADQDLLVSPCTLSEGTAHGQGIHYPVMISQQQTSQVIGFTNFLDSDMTRRQPLLYPISENQQCPTTESFSFMIARHYLESKGKTYQKPEASDNYTGNLSFGDFFIQRRTKFTGGYQGDLNEPMAYQILLNYRLHKGDITHFAHQATLQDILEDKNNSFQQQIKGKIVIIGLYSEYSNTDIFFTPFGKKPGVIVQAQMVSQLVSAVLDKRPLIWWWPVWSDILWIISWSTLGGLITWHFRRPVAFVLIAVSLTSQVAICYFVFRGSGWIPLIPPIIGLTLTARVVVRQTSRLRKVPSQQKTKAILKILSLAN